MYILCGRWLANHIYRHFFHSESKSMRNVDKAFRMIAILALRLVYKSGLHRTVDVADQLEI